MGAGDCLGHSGGCGFPSSRYYDSDDMGNSPKSNRPHTITTWSDKLCVHILIARIVLCMVGWVGRWVGGQRVLSDGFPVPIWF